MTADGESWRQSAFGGDDDTDSSTGSDDDDDTTTSTSSSTSSSSSGSSSSGPSGFYSDAAAADDDGEATDDTGEATRADDDTDTRDRSADRDRGTSDGTGDSGLTADDFDGDAAAADPDTGRATDADPIGDTEASAREVQRRLDEPDLDEPDFEGMRGDAAARDPRTGFATDQPTIDVSGDVPAATGQPGTDFDARRDRAHRGDVPGAFGDGLGTDYDPARDPAIAAQGDVPGAFGPMMGTDFDPMRDPVAGPPRVEAQVEREIADDMGVDADRVDATVADGEVQDVDVQTPVDDVLGPFTQPVSEAFGGPAAAADERLTPAADRAAEGLDASPVTPGEPVEGFTRGVGQVLNIPGQVESAAGTAAIFGSAVTDAEAGPTTPFGPTLAPQPGEETIDASEFVGEQVAEQAQEEPGELAGAAAGGAVFGTLGATAAARGLQGGTRVTRRRVREARADEVVDFDDLTGPAVQRGDADLPEFQTDPGAPTGQAVSEVRRRAADQPEGVQRSLPDDTRSALFRTDDDPLPGDLTVQRGDYELPGLFVSPDASPLRLAESPETTSAGVRVGLPRLRDRGDQLTVFPGDRIEGMPDRAAGAGRATPTEAERGTPGAQFLDTEAERGTAFVRPRGDRTTELEAIFPPDSEFVEGSTRLAVRTPEGRAIPGRVFERADQPDAPGGAAGDVFGLDEVPGTRISRPDAEPDVVTPFAPPPGTGPTATADTPDAEPTRPPADPEPPDRPTEPRSTPFDDVATETIGTTPPTAPPTRDGPGTTPADRPTDPAPTDPFGGVGTSAGGVFGEAAPTEPGPPTDPGPTDPGPPTEPGPSSPFGDLTPADTTPGGPTDPGPSSPFGGPIGTAETTPPPARPAPDFGLDSPDDRRPIDATDAPPETPEFRNPLVGVLPDEDPGTPTGEGFGAAFGLGGAAGGGGDVFGLDDGRRGDDRDRDAGGGPFGWLG